MASFADISIRFKANLKQFSSQMQNAERRMKKVGKRFESVGGNLSRNFTAPVVAGLALVTKGTEELRSNLGRLDTNAEIAKASLKGVREELVRVNGVTGEVDSSVEGISNLLASGFKGEQLSQALNNIQGAAIKFSDTLKFEGVADGLQETLATGKAIGPFAELLERSGISLDNFNAGLQQAIANGTQQNFVLEKLANAGLADVNKKFRENNKDVTSARESQLRFQLAMADLAKTVQPIINKVLEVVADLAEAFTNLSPAVKKTALVIAGLSAAAGPIIAGLGFLMTTVIPGLITAFGALSAPILAVSAAIGGIAFVVFNNFDAIKKELVNLANYFIDLYNESLVVRIGVESIINVFKNLFEIGKLVFEGLKTAIKAFSSTFMNVFTTFGKVFKAVMTGNFGSIPDILENSANKAKDIFTETLTDIARDLINFKSGIDKNLQDSLNSIGKRKDLIVPVTAEVKEVKQSSDNSNSQNGSSGRAKISGLSSNLESRGKKDTSIDGQLANFGLGAFNDKAAEMLKKADKIKEKARLVSREVSSAFSKMTNGIVESIGLANKGFEGFVKNIISLGFELVNQLITQAIQNIAIKKAEAVANSVAGATASAAATGPGAIFTQPAFISTMVGGVLSAFAAIPKFAEGGIVSGETLGIMGEYSGAKNNPEVVAPLDKLKGMLGESGGNQKVEVVGKLSGQDILISSDRANKYRNRRS